MFAKTTRTERILILVALSLATLILLVIFISTLGKYIASIQPTPTQRSLPPIVSATAAPLPTLRPTSTLQPTWTPAVIASSTPE